MLNEPDKAKAYPNTKPADEDVSVLPEKTVLKSLSLGGLQLGGVPCAVDVENEKIIRIKPLHYEWKYDKKEFNLCRG